MYNDNRSVVISIVDVAPPLAAMFNVTFVLNAVTASSSAERIVVNCTASALNALNLSVVVQSSPQEIIFMVVFKLSFLSVSLSLSFFLFLFLYLIREKNSFIH